MRKSNEETYHPLTPAMMLGLAAPHTWVAAIMPATVGTCLASTVVPVSIPLVLDMLVIVILMQAAVNTFNDYYDYIKGTDSASDAVEASDSILVYNHVNPRSALVLAIGMLVCAFLLGIFPILEAGFAPLAIALVGALCVVIYSAGKTPLSYLPLGEIVSGFVMGGLIPLAFVQVLTGALDLLVLFWSLPIMIGIGLIMATNNISDIEKDKIAKRSTLAVILGRKNACSLYALFVALWVLAMILCSALGFSNGLILIPFALLVAIPQLRTLYLGHLEPGARPRSMGAIVTLNAFWGAFYCAMILM